MNETLDQKMRYRAAVARAHSQVISGQSATVMVKETPAYSGRARQILLPIVLGNLVLTLLTLGIYRFWAKTRVRRYFISRVSFLGDPLEYAGTGMELFKGFLIVLAVMVPLLTVTGAIQQFVFSPDDLFGAALFQVGYMLLLVFLYYIAWYRAQRYRLSRTSWRGIRGGQQGSALVFALYALGLGFLTVLTVGLAYPLMARVLAGYRINRTCIGAETLRFSGGLWKLYAGWMVPWLIYATILGLFGFAVWQQYLAALAQEDSEFIRDLLAGMFSGGINRLNGSIYLALALIPVYLLVSIWYSAFETRVWINNTRFDRLEFKSRLGMIHILAPYLGYMFVLLVAAAVVLGTGFAVHRNLSPETKAAAMPFAPLAVYGVLATLWLVAGIVKPQIIQNWLIRNFCKTTRIQGSFSPDRLFQSQLQIPRRGEGLADALDVDAF